MPVINKKKNFGKVRIIIDKNITIGKITFWEPSPNREYRKIYEIGFPEKPIDITLNRTPGPLSYIVCEYRFIDWSKMKMKEDGKRGTQ